MNAVSQKKVVTRLNWIKLGFFVSLMIIFTFMLFKINNMFISVLLAVITDQILRPLVDLIEDGFGWSRGMASSIVFLIAGFVFVSLVLWSLPFVAHQIQVLKTEIAGFSTKTNDNLLIRVEDFLKGYIPFIEGLELADQIQRFFVSQTTQLMQVITNFFTNSISVFLIYPLLSFYMIKDAYSIRKRFLALVPNHIFGTTLSLTHQIAEQNGAFIRARVVESIIIGVLTGVGLQFISFPYVFLLGFFAGFMNIIPYLGPLIGYLPALMIAIFNGMDIQNIVILTLVYLIVQLVDNIILIPVLIARMTKMHAISVVIAILGGAQFLGILGIIIAIPVVRAFQVIYQAFYKHIIDAEAFG